MIELPEQVTITMYKDKQGNLYKTQELAIQADFAVQKHRLSGELYGIIYYDSTFRAYKVIEPYSTSQKEMSDISEEILEFLSEKWDKVLPIVESYNRIKKAFKSS